MKSLVKFTLDMSHILSLAVLALGITHVTGKDAGAGWLFTTCTSEAAPAVCGNSLATPCLVAPCSSPSGPTGCSCTGSQNLQAVSICSCA